MYKKIMSVMLIFILILTSTLVGFAADTNQDIDNHDYEVDENGDPLTTVIDGEIYYLVEAPAPEDLPITRAPMYDWKVGPVYNTSKHIKELTLEAAKTAVGTVLRLPKTDSAVLRLAKGIMKCFVIGTSINVYYTEHHYYASNVTGYGGYPYYCKFLTYQYKDKERKEDITNGDPPLKYYYAYQPY